MSSEFDLFIESCPEVGSAYLGLFREMMKRPALDARTKQLILIAVMCAQNYPQGVRAHVPQAIKAGASEQEMVEALLCTLPVAGIGGVIECLPAVTGRDGEQAADKRGP